MLPDTSKSLVHTVKSNNGITVNDKETADKFSKSFTSMGNSLAYIAHDESIKVLYVIMLNFVWILLLSLFLRNL